MNNPPHSEWSRFADAHPHLRPPLRPTKVDVATVESAIAGTDATVLMLGVTPELAILGRKLTAIDGCQKTIDRVWPGDQANRHALHGDWLELPIPTGAIEAVIGDGIITALGGNLPGLLREIRRVLTRDGVAVLRTFCAPEDAESLVFIAQDVQSGWIGNFHALKLRMAMSIAAEHPGRSIPASLIRHTFNEIFPDRAALSERTGWPANDIATIDFYDGAKHNLLFPTLETVRELALELFGSFRVLPSLDYPLADRCPTLVMRHA